MPISRLLVVSLFAFTLGTQTLAYAQAPSTQAMDPEFATQVKEWTTKPEFLSPLIAGGWLYAYLHACDPSADVGLDRLTRYRRGEAERARYTFIHYGDDELSSVVIDGAGVDWDDEGVKRLSSVSWERIPLPVPETFCTRSDPFC